LPLARTRRAVPFPAALRVSTVTETISMILS
jgi:hypothetical protein